MSNFMESWIDRLATKWLPKLPGCKPLEDHTERFIAGNHFGFHATLAFSFMLYFGILGALVSAAWCIAAEWGKQGRRIDVITRMSGVITALLVYLFSIIS